MVILKINLVESSLKEEFKETSALYMEQIGIIVEDLTFVRKGELKLKI